MAPEDLIEDGELVITMTRAGCVKAVAASTYRTQGRRTWMRGTNLREADIVSKVISYHGSRLPAVLLQPRPGLPSAGSVPLQSGLPGARPSSTCCRSHQGERIQALIDTREFHSTSTCSSRASRVTWKTAFAEYGQEPP